MPGWLRSPWFLGAAALALLVAGFLWATTAFVPRLVQDRAAQWTRTNLGLELTMGAVRFDPLGLALDIEGIAIPAGPEPMVRTGPIHIDFAFWSIFGESWRFDTIRVETPFIDARIAEDGSLNLAKLVPPPDDEPLPPVLIADLQVRRGQLAFTDRSRGADAGTRLLPVELALQDLHTTRDAGGRFRLAAVSDAGETLAWTGTVSFAPLGSTGGIAVRAIDGERLGRFLGETFPTRIVKGRGEITLSYRASLADGVLRLAVRMPRMLWKDMVLRIRPDVLSGEASAGAVDMRNLRFDLGPAGNATRWSVGVEGMAGARLRLIGTDAAKGEALAIRLLSYTDLRAASDMPAIRAARLGVDGLELEVVRGPGGGIGLAKFLPAASGDAGGSPPPLVIDAIAIADSRLVFDERSTPRRQRYEIAPLAATIRGFAMGTGTPLAIEASAKVNGQSLAIAGTIEPDAPRADLGVKLDRLPLALSLPYLPDFPALELISGTLSIDGRIRAAPARRGGFELGFDGAVDVADFRLRELVRNSDLFRFRAFRMRGIAFDGRQVTIEEGRLAAPVGQVALLADGQFNYGFLLDEGVSIEEAAARLDRRKAPARKLTRAERREAEAKAEAEKASRAAARAAARKAPAPEIAFTMKRLAIEDGKLAFADLVVEPDFQADIRALNGRITNLSNRPGAVATVDLSGHVVDRFSPVVIRGTMNPLDYAEATDMHLEFRNIDLPVFNPYSGTYAGYAIAKGKLTTELDYRIRNAALEANHKVRIDQLEWGEATESKEKVGLPIRFATSVMKDRNGVIEFELPVSGSVDDPAFRLAPLVWKFLGQFVGKLVTAPFRALGGLFADGEDAQFVDFAPGSSALPDGAADTLSEIGKALGEKPELRVDIPAAPGVEADARAIAAERLEAALMMRERRKDPGADFEALPLEVRHERMEDLYRAVLKKKPAPLDRAGVEDRDAARERALEAMRADLVAAYLPGGEELRLLGLARAEAVRLALLAPGSVDAARVFVDANDALVAKDDRVRMELKLK